MDLNLDGVLKLNIARQTMKDHWKTTIILALLFSGMAVMYAGMFPSFEDMMVDMAQSNEFDQFAFIPGYQDMASYVGFLNIEMYQIFWALILAIILGFIASATVAKEIESKTIDVLMSNPVSRPQIIIEKFIGLLPMLLIINFTAMLVIMGTTIGIGEELDFFYLFLTHLISIPYFLSIMSMGIFISTLVDEKMKASIITMAIVVGMFIFDSIAQLTTDLEWLGSLSLKHYFNSYDTLKFGEIDGGATGILLFVIIAMMIASIWYFDYKDITV
jgi:ABC-2 type transport system permease protein